MKKILSIISVVVLIVFLLLVDNSKTDYIKIINDDLIDKFHIEFSGCEVEYTDIIVSSFHGDNEKFAVFNCKNNEIDFTYRSARVKEFPLSKNLEKFVYGDESNSSINLNKYNIPIIKDGYYYFEDIEENHFVLWNDDKFLTRNSFNFTLIMYDLDNQFLYYYKIVT